MARVSRPKSDDQNEPHSVVPCQPEPNNTNKSKQAINYVADRIADRLADKANTKDQDIKATTSFGDAFASYAGYALTKKSWRNIESNYRCHLKRFDDRKLDTITPSELQALHGSLCSSSGKTAANRVLELVSAIYGYAIDLEMYDGANPTRKVKKNRLKSRERFLAPHEVAPFLASVERCKSEDVRDFIKLALFTSARAGNVLEMQWCDIDLDQGIWHIPETKNGDSQHTPLIPECLEILLRRKSSGPRRKYSRSRRSRKYSRSRRKSSDPPSPYVFPGLISDHIACPRSTWYSICARAGLMDFRIHDLRRSHASWQALCGVPLHTIGKTLNHKDYRSTLIYARLDLDPVRKAMTMAVNAMLSQTHPQAPSVLSVNSNQKETVELLQTVMDALNKLLEHQTRENIKGNPENVHDGESASVLTGDDLEL